MMRSRVLDLDAVRKARASLARIAKDFPEFRETSSRDNRQRWEVALQNVMADKTSGQDEQLVVRLPRALLERVDTYAERLRAEQPGPAWKRSDVVRLLLARALDAVEPKRGKR